MTRKIGLLIIPVFITSFIALRAISAAATEIPEVNLNPDTVERLNEETYSVTFDLSTNSATTDNGENASIPELLDISEEDASALANTNHLDDFLSENLVGEVKTSGDKITVANPYALDTLLVEVDNEAALSNYELENTQPVSENFYVVELTDAATTKSVYEQMSSDSNIKNVVPDAKIYATNDGAFGSSPSSEPFSTESTSAIDWGVTGTGMDHYTDWLKYSNADSEVIVGVLDTGINPNHEVFIDENGNSRIYLDGTNKYNYYSSYSDLPSERYSTDDYTDDNGHGTATAGLIAESTPSNVKIFPIKVLDGAGQCSTADVIKAITEKIDIVDVFNLSLGASLADYVSLGFSQAYYNQILDYFNSAIASTINADNTNTILVGSAGNNAENSVAIPAASEYVIAVSATDKDNAFASSFSNYGAEVDFAMPGKNITVPYYLNNSAYTRNNNGTSFSAPYLSAAVALIKATSDSNLSKSDIYSALQSNTIDLGDSGWDKYYGYGLVDFGATKFTPGEISLSSVLSDDKTSSTITAQIFSTEAPSAYAITTTPEAPTDSVWQTISTPAETYGSSTHTAISVDITENNTYYFWIKDASNNTTYAITTIDGIEPISADIEPGIYIIHSALSSSGVIDISGGSDSSGSNAQIYVSNNTPAQKFIIREVEDGIYEIENLKSSKVLDVSGGTARNTSNVQQYTANGTCAQRWKIIEIEKNQYSFASACDFNYLLDITGGNTNNGANLQLYENNGTTAQRFTLTQIEAIPESQNIKNGSYTIVPALDSDKALDISNGSLANGGNLQLYARNNTGAQTFIIKYRQSGFYTITNASSGKTLDVSGGTCANSVNVQQWQQNNTMAQQWLIKQNSDGTYSFVSRCNGYYLDINGGGTSNGTNLQIYAKNDTAAQKFNLVTLI